MKSSVNKSLYILLIKPVFDRLVALLIILLAMPIIVIVIVLLLLFNKGKTIFIQKRIGLNEKPFMAFKFKTMNDQTDLHGNLLSDEKRLTPFGKFIRRTSLDELPQLVNILKGDMSFVGPRPLLPEYLPYYNSVQRRRHQVMPGITGLAQINGRNLTSWERRFELDVQYVEQVSFVLDVKILVSTIVKVLKSEGISAKGHATMPKFSDYVKQQQN